MKNENPDNIIELRFNCGLIDDTWATSVVADQRFFHN